MDIIPVTYSIRQYLIYQEEMKKKIKMFSEKNGFSLDEYNIFLRNSCINIEKKNDNKRDYNSEFENRVMFLKNIAKKINKSSIWVYQELVLSGYGEYISSDSDIYQLAMLAYEDVSYILENKGEESAIMFENSSVLNGNVYENDVKYGLRKIKN